MENTHVSNKKFYMTVASLAFAFLAAIGAVVGIWAATSQSISAGFNIVYEVGSNVAAAVRTEYYVPGLDANADGYEDGAIVVTKNKAGDEVQNTDGYVVFDVADDTETKAVYIGDFNLTAKTPVIEFYFTVRSDLEAGFVCVDFTPNYTAQQNVSVDVSYYMTSSFTDEDSASTIADSSFVDVLQDGNFVGKDNYMIIKIVAHATDVNADAAIAGSFTLDLSFATSGFSGQ